jgi:tetratricopeptide (TPR) repeat protein
VLGDIGGLADVREAIELATEAGRGSEVALIYNNLGQQHWAFEGPEAALVVLREGIVYAKARGLAGALDSLTESMLDALVETDALDEVLAIAAEVAPRLEASADIADLQGFLATQARALALRGQAMQAADVLARLESSSRELGSVEDIVQGLGSAALVRAELEQDEAVAALLVEVEACPGAREDLYYPPLLPAMVRAALRIGELELAERLVADYEPRTPYAEHAFVAANASLAEAGGDLQAAADAYAEAADRWDRFGVVPEQAFALLGQGRCLLGLSRPTEAAPVLQHASEIFERLRAVPSLAETDALLQRTTAFSS